MPKLDPLVAGRYDRAAVLRGLGLDPALPTVLFAPTWIRGGCLDAQGEAILERLAAQPRNVVVKLHDNSLDLRKQRRDWAAEVARHAAAKGSRLRLATGHDSNPYLAAADAMVSDASSVANEYLLLDRPLVLFRLPDLEREWPATDRATWGLETGIAIDRAAELDAALERALADPAAKRDVRRAAAADFFYHPGRAAPVAAALLRRYAGVESAAAKAT